MLAKLCQALAAADPAARAALVRSAAPEHRPGLQALLDGPDPSAALRRAAALPAAAFAHATGLPPRLGRLLHEGTYPARLVALVPDAVAVLRSDAAPRPLDRDATVAELTTLADRHGLADALGHVRTREYLRLCAREVEGAPLEEIGSDLRALVGACIEVGLRTADIAEQVCTLGMGKLGGDELNFLSDIDLVFVHADTLTRDAVVALHDALRRIVRALEGEGRWRPLFRVDLRLRPFGRRGPLSLSVSATEAYYERHGRPWERQVWIRALPLAGRIDLGRTIIERLRPFVYRKSVSPAIFAEIEELMQRARREAATAIADDDAIDLKLDTGGIRQVEFTVQALQLLHGGRRPELRVPGTLPALDRLLGAGLVSDREHRELTFSYRFLRRVEHRVQLGEGQQTHRVPPDPEARARLVARLATTDPAFVAFDELLARHRAGVAAIAETLGGGAPPKDDPRPRDIATVLDSGAPVELRRAALSRLGVRDSAEAEALLAHLATRPEGVFADRGPAREGADALLVACLDSADPDSAIAGLAKFAEHRRAHYAVWRFFADPASAPARRLAGELLSSSETLARGLIGFAVGRGALPDDAMELLMSTGGLPDAAAHEAALHDHPIDPRGFSATMLRFKHRQVARIALYDLGHRPDPFAVGRALSDLADLVVTRVLQHIVQTIGDDGPPFFLAVIAVGKYGMQAMDYGSDLDLMFVFEAKSDRGTLDMQSRAIRIAQALVKELQNHALGSRLYEVDVRLRPSGRQGLLVTGLTGFAHYHAGHLPIWERLASMRVRPVVTVQVGDAAQASVPPADPDRADPLGDRVLEIVHASLGWRADAGGEVPGAAPPPTGMTDDAIARGVRDLLDRIAREVAREDRAKGRYDAKSGPGGALELELLVGALQLRHGAAHPSVRSRGIIAALDGLAQAGVLPPPEARALAADYAFLRALLNRLRMTNSGDPDRFSQNSPRLTTLARRMGLADERALSSEFHRIRDHVRAELDRHLHSGCTPAA